MKKVPIGGLTVGNDCPLLVIAGPCQLESLDHAQMIAGILAEACRAAAEDSQLQATDLADDLVRQGVPFREAHHLVGAAVALAEKAGRRLHELTLGEWRRISTKFGSKAPVMFDLDRAMRRRALPGAPSPREVRRQLARWRRVLGNPHLP